MIVTRIRATEEKEYGDNCTKRIIEQAVNLCICVAGEPGTDGADGEARFAVDGRTRADVGELRPAYALGLSAQIGAGICFALSRYDRRALLAVIVCLALNWLGDSLDGTLARVRRQERPRYGFYVDHIVDILGAVALMCGLGFSGLLH